jgi:hypothetical protein
MAAAAQARGYEYIALTDHSRRVAMTHGLDPARLARQLHEIDRLNDRLKGFTILRGIEVDILKDGRLDLPDASLAKLDVVVAAVHSHFDLPRKAQTERVVRALENRHVSILAHPTGRLLGEREPYDIDMDAVISTVRKAGCYLEINAEPDRLDLNDLHARRETCRVKLASRRMRTPSMRSVHAVQDRSGAARLAHGRDAEYEAACRIAETAETVGLELSDTTADEFDASCSRNWRRSNAGANSTGSAPGRRSRDRW